MTREWTDEDLLRLLDDQADGVSATVTARRFRVSRSAVLGLRKRIRNQTDRHFGADCPHDGTLPPGWWRAGLAARRRQGGAA